MTRGEAWARFAADVTRVDIAGTNEAAKYADELLREFDQHFAREPFGPLNFLGQAVSSPPASPSEIPAREPGRGPRTRPLRAGMGELTVNRC